MIVLLKNFDASGGSPEGPAYEKLGKQVFLMGTVSRFTRESTNLIEPNRGQRLTLNALEQCFRV